MYQSISIYTDYSYHKSTIKSKITQFIVLIKCFFLIRDCGF